VHITGDAVLHDAQNFSLVLGGPLYQLLRRAHLSGNAVSVVRQRVVVIALLGWLPLLILSAVQGHLWGRSVAMPFLLDLEVHIRFLIVVPLLVIAELVVHKRLRPIAKAFLERNLIREDDLPRFDKAIISAFRLRNSVIAEVLLVLIVYGVGVSVVWHQFTALAADSWYAPAALTGSKLSLAGYWYTYASLPKFQFLLIRPDPIKTRELTDEEALRVMKALDTPERRHTLPVFIAAMDTGARKSSLLDYLRWKDINLADEIITLTAYKGKGGNIKPKRWPVQMTGRLKKELLQLQLQRTNKNDDALVFEPAKVNLRKLWTAAYAEAAVPKGTRYFYSVRHNFGTEMANEGIPLPALAKLMGHSDVKMTMRYYNMNKKILDKARHILDRRAMVNR